MRLLHLVVGTAMLLAPPIGNCLSAASLQKIFQLEGQLWRVDHADKRLPNTVYYFMQNGMLTVYIKGIGAGGRYRLSGNKLCIAQRESNRCFSIKEKSETKMILTEENGVPMFLTKKEG